MIADRIYEWARSQPTRIALIYGDYRLDYASFFRAIETSRRFFQQQQLPAGQTAIVICTNLLEGWIFLIALRALGLTTVAMHDAAQVADLKIKDVACVVVIESEEGEHDLRTVAVNGVKVITVPVAMLAESQTADLSFGRQDERPCGGHIIFSSGTTGTPKAIMMAGTVDDKRNAARARSLSYRRQTVYHGLALGWWSGSGFKNPSAVWHVGGCVVLDQQSDLGPSFARDPITCSSLTPPTLRNLIQTSDPRRPPNNQLELSVSAGFLPIELAEAAVARLTDKLMVTFSCSELIAVPMRARFKTVEDLHWLVPAEGKDVQIVDERGNECATNSEGDLRIRTTDIDCTAYLDNDEANARVFRNGFFYPGDIAVRRLDGRIRVLGRAADVLNWQGSKIAVAPIESTLQRALGVSEVCLFAGLDDRGREELVVAIQSDRTVPQSELDALRDRLSSFQRVRFSVLKEFPRTETGARKTRRAELRKLVFAKVQPSS